MIIGGSPLTSAWVVYYEENLITIFVAAFAMQYGFGQVGYHAANIISLAGSTTYYVYCSDPTMTGGAVAYLATTTASDIVSSQSNVFIGSITTPSGPADGQTVGTGGGGSWFGVL